MTGAFRLKLIVLTALAAFVGGATVKPGGLASAWPGMWEISRSATGANPERVCLPDPAYLARWEHRRSTCSVSKLTERANMVAFDYHCARGGFGRSDVTLLTPRSLRIKTQGIRDGAPFDNTLHARWMRQCRPR